MFMKTVLDGSPWDPECQEVMDLAMRYQNSEKNVWLWAFGDQDEKMEWAGGIKEIDFSK